MNIQGRGGNRAGRAGLGRANNGPGRAGSSQQWVGPKPSRTKIGSVFSGQDFNSPVRLKNRADRAK